jgi:serralysin
MAYILGTGKDDKIITDSGGDDVRSKAGNDQIEGGTGNDVLMAGGGDDVVTGGSGDDIIYGSNFTPGGFNQFIMAEDYSARVVFQNESAGYKNALGAYTFDQDGNVTGVKILFANASLKDSGGDLVSGQSGIDMPLAKGERLGFFVVPNGFDKSDLNAKLLSQTEGKFMLKDATGSSNILNAKALTLSYVDGAGKETQITSQYGKQLFHSVVSLNEDGLDHVHSKVDAATGQLTVGFEDLLGGGDKDYDDSVFTVDIGKTTAQAWATKTTATGNDNDNLSGGDGKDKIYGMRGDDTVAGGNGDDQLFGNSGNDQMTGDAGNDTLGGGKGDDTLSGGAGNDKLSGDSGNDRIADGLGNDQAKGGTGDDFFVAGAGGRDSYAGGKGFDTVDYGTEYASKTGMTVDLSKGTATGGGVTDKLNSIEGLIGTTLADKISGSKVANSLFGMGGDDMLRGKAGNDMLDGGAGKDTFVWGKGDLANSSVDDVYGFNSKEDKLDLDDVLQGKFDGKLTSLHLTDTSAGTMLSIDTSAGTVNVAMLHDVHGFSVADLSTAGALIL